MRLYETTFIINPQADDNTLEQNVKAIVELINTSGGKVVRENRMGTRRLAYQIEGLNQGYYANLVFEGTVELLPVLERHFKLEEQYVRYLTVRFEGKLPPEEEETATGDEEEKKAEPAADETGKEEPAATEESKEAVTEPAAEPEAEPKVESEEPAKTEPVVGEEPKHPADESTDTPPAEQEEL